MDESISDRARRWWRRAIHIIRSIISLLRRSCSDDFTDSSSSSSSAARPVRSEKRQRAFEAEDSLVISDHSPVRRSSNRRQKIFVLEADVHAAQSQTSTSSQDTGGQVKSLASASSNDGEHEGSHAESLSSPQVPKTKSSAAETPACPCCSRDIHIEVPTGERFIIAATLARDLKQIFKSKSASYAAGPASLALGTAPFAIPLRVQPTVHSNQAAREEANTISEAVSHRETATHGPTSLHVGPGLQEGPTIPDEPTSHEIAPHRRTPQQKGVDPRKELVQHGKPVTNEEMGLHAEQSVSYTEAPRHSEAVSPGEAASREEVFSDGDSDTRSKPIPEREASSSNSDPAALSGSLNAPAYSPFTSHSSGIGVSPAPKKIKLGYDSTASINSNQPSLEMDEESHSAGSTASFISETTKSPSVCLGSPPARTPSNLYGEGPSGLCRMQHRAEPPPLLRDATRYEQQSATFGSVKKKSAHSSTCSSDVTIQSTPSTISSLSPPSNQAGASAQPSVDRADSESSSQQAPLALPQDMPGSPKELDVAQIVLPQESRDRPPQPEDEPDRHEGHIEHVQMNPNRAQPGEQEQNHGVDPHRNDGYVEFVQIRQAGEQAQNQAVDARGNDPRVEYAQIRPNRAEPEERGHNYADRLANMRLWGRVAQNHEEQAHNIQPPREAPNENHFYDQVIPADRQLPELEQFNEGHLPHDHADLAANMQLERRQQNIGLQRRNIPLMLEIIQEPEEVELPHGAHLPYDPARLLEPHEVRRRFYENLPSPPLNGMAGIFGLFEEQSDSDESGEEEELDGISIGDEVLEDDVFE